LSVRYIFWYCSTRNAKDPKRENCLKTLANACLDCQQVQAREILRLYRELSNQHQTFPNQIRCFLQGLKESAIETLITRLHHPSCDWDHTRVSPGGQRAHLKSAYYVMFGKKLGMLDITPAKSDRFLSMAQREMKKALKAKSQETWTKIIKSSISSRFFFEALLADINNQSLNADRSIDRNTIFKWAQQNLKDPHSVFYDADREADYNGTQPRHENKFEVFLSRKLLVKMLLKMNFIQPTGSQVQIGARVEVDGNRKRDLAFATLKREKTKADENADEKRNGQVKEWERKAKIKS